MELKAFLKAKYHFEIPFKIPFEKCLGLKLTKLTQGLYAKNCKILIFKKQIKTNGVAWYILRLKINTNMWILFKLMYIFIKTAETFVVDIDSFIKFILKFL